MGERRSARRSDVVPERVVTTYRPLDWFLLSGNRLLVSATMLAVVAGVLWWAVSSGVAPLVAQTPVLYLLFALISGNFTLVTIVVSISQFVLARHLESPGEVREQLREIVGYREEVSEITGESVIPVTPTGFFLLLFRSIDRDVDAIRNREWAGAEADLHRDVEDLLADLEDHAEHVIGLVEGGNGGIGHALFATMGTNYSRYFHGVYRLRAEYGDSLPDEVADQLHRLERNVEQVDVARRYFKTVLIQSELSSLSRLLLFIGLPVLLATVVLMLSFSAANGPVLARSTLALVIPVVVTAGFAPIVLLAAYILRLATVVRRTAAMYPFTTRFDD